MNNFITLIFNRFLSVLYCIQLCNKRYELFFNSSRLRVNDFSTFFFGWLFSSRDTRSMLVYARNWFFSRASTVWSLFCTRNLHNFVLLLTVSDSFEKSAFFFFLRFSFNYFVVRRWGDTKRQFSLFSAARLPEERFLINCWRQTARLSDVRAVHSLRFRIRMIDDNG